MALLRDDQKLVDEGLLTEREAVRLPQWAKSKIVRVMRERDAARTALEESKQGTGDSPFYVGDGLSSTRTPIGNKYSHIEVKRSGCRDIYDISIWVNGKNEIEIMGGSALSIELKSSNYLIIHTS